MDTFMYVLMGFITVVCIPWCAWVTTSIFAQKEQTSLLRQEVGLLENIRDLVVKRG